MGGYMSQLTVASMILSLQFPNPVSCSIFFFRLYLLYIPSCIIHQKKAEGVCWKCWTVALSATYSRGFQEAVTRVEHSLLMTEGPSPFPHLSVKENGL